MKPLAITACSTVNSAGSGMESFLCALRNKEGGLRPNDFPVVDIETFIGRVRGVEESPVIEELAEYDCRNNRLAMMALNSDSFLERVEVAREKYGPGRVAVLLGTSTSGILDTETAFMNKDADGSLPSWFRYMQTQNTFSITDFVRRFLKLTGPAASISTACSSSSKVFAAASRHIEAGLCDAVVVGGADSLCLTTLYGFTSLELVSKRPCAPCSAGRDGISIGEAAGFMLLEKAEEAGGRTKALLLGYGESSDAHHMSTPHPEGLGAELAMRRALERAGLNPSSIDYINMHGTATVANDKTEDMAIFNVFGNGAPASSTKGWTGHTLGAAGITEAAVSLLTIENGFIPGTLNTFEVDPALKSGIVLDNRATKVEKVLSNTFGFGGSNCSIIIGAA